VYRLHSPGYHGSECEDCSILECIPCCVACTVVSEEPAASIFCRKNRGSMLFQNAGTCLLNYMVSHLLRNVFRGVQGALCNCLQLCNVVQ
jgi:hypothetical protein